MPGETVLFQSTSSGITVTKSRLVVGQTTYVIANIDSVSFAIEKPPSMSPTTKLLVGCAAVIVGVVLWATGYGVGVFLIMFGSILAIASFIASVPDPPKYHLQITTNSGSLRAFSTPDYPLMQKLLGALNDAIASR